MNQIKKLLSYISDISLEKTESDYNSYLEVLLVKGRHQLITDNAIYSFDDKYDNFFKAFKKIDFETLKPEKVLVLGLGLGSVVLMLEKHFNVDAEFHCVEIDPVIIQLAQKYTFNRIESNIFTYQTDAEIFLKTCTENFDLILMDVFQDAKIPVHFDSDDFMELLKSNLEDSGLLLYNRMNIDEADVKRNKGFTSQFNKFFPSSTSISVKDNLILYSDRKFVT